MASTEFDQRGGSSGSDQVAGYEQVGYRTYRAGSNSYSTGQQDGYGEIFDPWDGDQAGDLRRSLLLTLLTVFIPGIGHAAAGRKRTGRVMLTAYLLLIATGVIAYVLLGADELKALALDTRVLRFVAYGCGVLAVAWSFAVLSTYAVNRPRNLTAGQGLGGGLLALLLALVVAAPLGLASMYSYTARDLIISWSGESTGKISGKEKLDYFKDRPRINLLLIGGDGTDKRQGIRTDSMMVASIDTRTGQTLMISLPRNLNRAPFPAGSEAADQFPDGFQCDPEIECYLNAMYRYAEDHKAIVPGAKHPGAELLSQSVEEMLDQKIDYYAMVNMAGFADIVDALGGIQIRVTKRTPIGGEILPDGTKIQPHDYIEPGLYKHMNGRLASWYARSRFGSDDYARMERQRCVMGAIARQANPQTVLTKFLGLAKATKNLVMTSIPTDAYPALLELAGKGKSTKITGVSVDKSLFGSNSDPDYFAIRAKVRSWIRKADADAEKALARATASPAPTASSGSGGTPSPTSTSRPKPTPTPGQANAIESTCKYK